jgi:hypothetical protein
MKRIREEGGIFRNTPNTAGPADPQRQAAPITPADSQDPTAVPVVSADLADPANPDGRYEWFLEELAALNPDKLTPMEALNLLYTWKQHSGGKPAPRSHRGSRASWGPTLFD